MNWWKSPKTFPFRIFMVALILRLVPVMVMRNMVIGLDDMFQYDMLARSIASGNGYRWYAIGDLPTVLPYLKLDLTSIKYDPRGVLTSFRPPLYPAFLAIIYTIFGVGAKRFFIARLIQTLLASSMAPLTYLLSLRLFPKQASPACLSAWVITLYPMLIIYPLSLATENLFFVLVLCSVLSILKAKDSLETFPMQKINPAYFLVKYRWFIFSGILLGLTCLTRSVAQVFAIFAIGWIWLFLREYKGALIALLMTGMIVFPWILRNSLLYGRLTGIESAIGYDLYLGYHPLGTGTFQYPQSLDLMTIMNDSEREQIGIQKSLEFIKADPGRIFPLFIQRTGYFFGLERRALTYFYSNDYFGHITNILLNGIFALFCLPFVIVSISGVMGIALSKGDKNIWLIVIFLIGYITPHLIIIAEDRFHLSIVPFLSVFAAICITGDRMSIHQSWIMSKRGKVKLILAFIVIILLISNWGLELWHDADKLALLFGPSGNQTYFSY